MARLFSPTSFSSHGDGRQQHTNMIARYKASYRDVHTSTPTFVCVTAVKGRNSCTARENTGSGPTKKTVPSVRGEPQGARSVIAKNRGEKVCK